MGNDDLERRLRDADDPLPPASLRARLEQGIPGSFRQRETGARRRWNMAKISMATAAAAALVWAGVALLAPSGVTVAGVLEPVMAASGSAEDRKSVV